MAKISVYTTILNGVFMEYLVPECVLSCLNFADEIVVVDGGSEDRTHEIYQNLSQKHPKIKLYTHHWHEGSHLAFAEQKECARRLCTGDWLIRLDHDECFHEKNAKDIRDLAETGKENAYRFPRVNFYRYPELYKPDPHDTAGYMYMYRNNPILHHQFSIGNLDGIKTQNGSEYDTGKRIPNIHVYHYGYVRRLEIMQYKEKRINYHFRDVYPEATKYKEGNTKLFEWDMTGAVLFSETHPKVMEARNTHFSIYTSQK